MQFCAKCFAEGKIEELKAKANEYNKKVNDTNSEIENANKKKQKLQESIEEAKSRANQLSEKLKNGSILEDKIEQINKKTQSEIDSTAKFQKELGLLQKTQQCLIQENEELLNRLAATKEKSLEASLNTKKSTSGEASNEQILEELRKNYLIFEKLKTEMKSMSISVQSIETMSNKNVITETTTVTNTLFKSSLYVGGMLTSDFNKSISNVSINAYYTHRNKFLLTTGLGYGIDTDKPTVNVGLAFRF